MPTRVPERLLLFSLCVLFVVMGAWAAPVQSNWITGNGIQLLTGSGRDIHTRHGKHVVDFDVTDAVLAGDRLFLLTDRSIREEHAGKYFSPPDLLHVEPDSSSPVRLALMDNHLVIAGMDGGISVIQVGFPMHKAHGQGQDHKRKVIERGRTTASVKGRVTALAVSWRTIIAGTESGEIAIIDAADPDSPELERRLNPGIRIDALALNGTRAYLLGEGGLWLLDLAAESPHPFLMYSGVAGQSLLVTGREIHIAAGDTGVLKLIDDSPQALTHQVSVGNNFFTPESLSINVGDTVQWSNTAGFHNVFSCTATQFGCTEVSNEQFSNSPSTFWVFDHTFQLEGENPYLCQPHSSQMPGNISVGTAQSPPPVVPDGAAAGAPMTVTPLDVTGDTLSIAWDTVTCSGAANHHIIWGGRSGLLPVLSGGTIQISGSICGLGTVSPYIWTNTPDPALEPTGVIWWLVVASDTAGLEGGWGLDSNGQERPGPVSGSSGECGVTSKDLSNGCGL